MEQTGHPPHSLEKITAVVVDAKGIKQIVHYTCNPPQDPKIYTKYKLFLMVIVSVVSTIMKFL